MRGSCTGVHPGKVAEDIDRDMRHSGMRTDMVQILCGAVSVDFVVGLYNSLGSFCATFQHLVRHHKGNPTAAAATAMKR